MKTFTITVYDNNLPVVTVSEDVFTQNQRDAIRYIFDRRGKDPIPPKASPAIKTAVADVAGFDRRDEKVARRATALAQGYTGDACGKCQMFTLKWAGHCQVCDNCGETTGCS